MNAPKKPAAPAKAPEAPEDTGTVVVTNTEVIDNTDVVADEAPVYGEPVETDLGNGTVVVNYV